MYLNLLIFIITLYLIGNFFNSLFYKKTIESYQMFISICLGLLILTTTYVLIKTSFKSSTFLIFILTLLFFLTKKKSITHEKVTLKLFFRIKTKEFIFFLISFTVSIIYWKIVYYSMDGELLSLGYPFNDLVYYSDVSRGIDHTCNENRISTHFQLFKSNSVILYHFFELWINTIFVKISGTNYYNSLLLITYPFLFGCYFYGLYSISCQFLKKKNNLFKVFMFFVPFSISLPFSISNEFETFSFYGAYLNIGDIYNIKIILVYLISLISIKYLAEIRLLEFIFLSFLTTIIYPTTIVGLFPAILVFLIVSYFLFKSKRKEVLYLLIISVLYIVFFFYLKEIFIKSTKLSHIENIKSILIISIENILKYLIVYLTSFLSVILILIKLYKNHKKHFNTILSYLIFSLSALISSSIFSALFIKTVDVNQSISNLFPAITTSLFLLSVLFAINNNIFSKNIRLTFCLIILLISTQSIIKNFSKTTYLPFNYSNEYTTKVTNEIQNYKNIKLLSISKTNQESDENLYRFQTAPYISKIKTTSRPYDISFFFKDTNNLRIKRRITEYIKKNNITHIVCHHEKKQFLKDIKILSTIFEDSISKETLFKISNKYKN